MSKSEPKRRAKAPPRPAFEIAGACVLAGRRARLELRVARLPTGSWVTLPLEVVHGSKPGPTVWVSAAVHGDELNGVPVIGRLLRELRPTRLAGTVIAVPIVNVFGALTESRYLPDRRDLNRSFPGSARGSMASRLAHLFMDEVVARADVGIDLHTGSDQRANLPQIRADLKDAATRELAMAFGPPALMHASERKGSLRQAAGAAGKKVLLYEAGEARRFSERAIAIGLHGTLRVLDHLGMRTAADAVRESRHEPCQIVGSSWARTPRSGFLEVTVELGQKVQKGERVARVADAFGSERVPVSARASGLVIGVSRAAVVHRGEAVVNVGSPWDGSGAA